MANLWSAVSPLIPSGSSERRIQPDRFRICSDPKLLTESDTVCSQQAPRFRLSRPVRLPISSGTSWRLKHPFRFRFTKAARALISGGRASRYWHRLRLRDVSPVSRARAAGKATRLWQPLRFRLCSAVSRAR